MFVLDPRAACLFRAVVRKCFQGPLPQTDKIPVQIRNARGGGMMYACQEEFAVSYRYSAGAETEKIAFPLSALSVLNGRGKETVEILPLTDGKAMLKWSEKGSIRSIEFTTLEADHLPEPPILPRSFESVTGELLAALHEASLTTAPSATRYALNRIQLRGKKGQIQATDSRQLLVQGGFKFGFDEDLLIPRTAVFGLPGLQISREIGLGRTKTHLFLRMDQWLVALKIDETSRFPDISSIIPSSHSTTTRLVLHPKDSVNILNALVVRWRKAGSKELLVTLDLGESSWVRLENDGRVDQTPLLHSEVTGQNLRIGLDLKQFLRALEMQFQEFEFHGPEKPFLSRSGDRLLLVMPKASSRTLPPVPESTARVSRQPVVEVPTPVHLPQESLNRFSGVDILDEADGLKTGVLKVAVHAGRLLSVLRTLYHQPQVIQMVRNSLQFLADCSTGSGDKHALESTPHHPSDAKSSPAPE